MKLTFLASWLVLVLATAVTPALRASDSTTNKAEVRLTKEQAAKIAEYRKAQAAINGDIAKLKTKNKISVEKPDRDAMSDLGSEESLRLQMMMEKKGQLEQMISNIMKSSSDTSSTITGNVKS